MHKSKVSTQKYSEGNTNLRVRLWCFTMFENHINVPNLNGNWQYILMGRETCPKTKKEHWQCFVYFKEAKTFNSTQKLITKHFGIKPHIEACKGSIKDNYNYCSKDKDFYEFGKKPSQGCRNDIDEVKDKILSYELSCDDICIQNPELYHKYGRTLNKIEDIAQRKLFRTEMTTCDWYYGPTGVGKSHKAFENFSPETHYVYPHDNGWWDGYKQQDIVIINDFRGEIPYNVLLDLIDKWATTVRRRCREPLPFISKHIIITSSLHPKDIYRNREAEDKIEQLLDRIKVIQLTGTTKRTKG